MAVARDGVAEGVPGDLGSICRLDSPDFYDDPYPIFKRMRREAPVFWFDSRRLWALTRNADIVHVLSDPQGFSSAKGTRLADWQRGRRGLAPGADPLFPTDPPVHTNYRRMVSGAFTPRRVAGVEFQIREVARDLLNAIPVGEPFDFVELFSEPLPIYAIASMLGFPRSDWVDLKRWSDVRVELLDAESGSERARKLESELEEYFAYLGAILEERHRQPQDDLISIIAAQNELSPPNQMQMINSLVVAGNETTRSSLSGGISALAEYVGEWEKLRTDPPGVSRTATEEVLRWGSPIRHFGRTALRDTTLRGRRIRKGEFVMLLYPSANRDEEVWQRPDEFDVTREPGPHLSFGSGIHYCLGAGLARLEIRVALEEIGMRFASVMLNGQVERLASVHVNQFTTVPVTLRRA